MLEFQALYDEFKPRIYRYLIYMVGVNEAEDVTQEVFAKVDRALKDFRGQSRLSTWIYRIATNAALDKIRGSSFRKDLVTDSISELEEHGRGRDAMEDDKVPSADREAMKQEMNACIRGYVEGLPEKYRTVLVLSEFEGLKNSEIAEILQVSLETVKIGLHRARAGLKEKLEQTCTFYHDERSELACDRKQPTPSEES